MEAGMIETESAGVVKLQGKWTIERAGELKGLLSGALRCGDEVFVELDEVTEADLSCLQLLYSACGSASKLGKRLTLRGSAPPAFVELARNAGFGGAIGFLQACGDDWK
jgi:anti-anti-sigma regulatory factor